jgi:hypothetical protein
MLGEHRQVLADLLWARAQNIINDSMTNDHQSEHQTDQLMSKSSFSEIEIDNLNRYFKEIRTVEDI